jgi:hypothetical protein
MDVVTFAGYDELEILQERLEGIVKAIEHGAYSIRLSVDGEFSEGFKSSVDHQSWTPGIGTMQLPYPGSAEPLQAIDGEGTDG